MAHIMEQYKGYLITTDKQLMKVHDIHKWLSEKSYWSKNIPFETVKSAFAHSFCIGTLIDSEQVGYARLITDYTTFAYLADVYVAEKHRGKGISKKMISLLLDLDWVKGLRAIHLATRDAQGLYRQHGFEAVKFPERHMIISRADIYENSAS